MKYEFNPSSIGENQVLFDDYISSLSDKLESSEF